MTRMRRFELQQQEDVVEIHVIAEGVEFEDGSVAIRWRRPWGSCEFIPGGIEAMLIEVAGEVVWIDKDMSVLSPPEPSEDHGKHSAVEPEDIEARKKLEHFFEPPEMA